VSAATANRNTRTRPGEREIIPVAASTTIYSGTMVCKNASGYAVPAADSPGLEFAGLAVDAADNSSGSAGDVNVTVEKAPLVCWAHSGIVQADEGKEIFAADDQTVQEAGGHVFVGRIAEYVSATEVWVDHRPAYNARVPSNSPLRVFCGEVDCENASEVVQLIPARANHGGLVVVAAFAVVTEQFGGDTEDQGVVTLYDSADASLNLTFTPADAGADAINDIIREAGSADDVITATSGDAGAVVGAGKGVYAKVTTAVSGASAAGKLKVVVIAAALAARTVDS